MRLPYPSPSVHDAHSAIKPWGSEAKLIAVCDSQVDDGIRVIPCLLRRNDGTYNIRYDLLILAHAASTR
jgi:hypothetical protein